MQLSDFRALQLLPRARECLGSSCLVAARTRRAFSIAIKRIRLKLAEIWRAMDAVDSLRVVILYGEGKSFSAGVDLQLMQDMANDVALLCGMAKAKCYLLLCESVRGEESERIGLA